MLWSDLGVGVGIPFSGQRKQLQHLQLRPGTLKAWVQVKQPFVGLLSLGRPRGSPPSHLWQGAFPLVGRHHPDEVQLVLRTMPFALEWLLPFKRNSSLPWYSSIPRTDIGPRGFSVWMGCGPPGSYKQQLQPMLLIKNPPVWRSKNPTQCNNQDLCGFQSHCWLLGKTVFQRNLARICTTGQLSYVPSGSIRHGVC